MDAATARSALKNRLGIKSDDTKFDSELDDFIVRAVDRLYPIAQYEVPMQSVDVSPDQYGEAVVNLSSLATPLLSARSVEACEFGSFYSVDDFKHHGVSLYVRGLSTGVSSVRIYGVTSFTLATLPDFLDLAVFWYAMSEFYNLMASNDAHYNIYMQSTGARAVDNMRSEAAFYEQQANIYLNDRAQIYGVS